MIELCLLYGSGTTQLYPYSHMHFDLNSCMNFNLHVTMNFDLTHSHHVKIGKIISHKFWLPTNTFLFDKPINCPVFLHASCIPFVNIQSSGNHGNVMQLHSIHAVVSAENKKKKRSIKSTLLARVTIHIHTNNSLTFEIDTNDNWCKCQFYWAKKSIIIVNMIS